MPVMTLFRSPGINQLQYDAIVQTLDVEHHPRSGALTHICAFDEKGMCVIDVWESRRDFEMFVADRLKPAFAKLGMPSIEPEVIDTYRFIAADGVDRYKVDSGPTFGAEREGRGAESRPL
jgi:hypothetical protein